MILVCLGVSIAITVAGIIMFNLRNYDAPEAMMIVGGIILTIASLVAAMALGSQCRELKYIEPKIQMYQEENAKIEESIAVVVQQYQDYEQQTFAATTKESVITLVSLYPELKSDTLVQKQIGVYVSNNNKIKSLKEQKIAGGIYHWWLCFGE